jgi:hypothetical protein
MTEIALELIQPFHQSEASLSSLGGAVEIVGADPAGGLLGGGLRRHASGHQVGNLCFDERLQLGVGIRTGFARPVEPEGEELLHRADRSADRAAAEFLSSMVWSRRAMRPWGVRL